MKRIEKLRQDHLDGLDEFIQAADHESDDRLRAFLMFLYMQCVYAVSDETASVNRIDMKMIRALGVQLYSARLPMKSVLFDDELPFDW